MSILIITSVVSFFAGAAAMFGVLAAVAWFMSRVEDDRMAQAFGDWPGKMEMKDSIQPEYNPASASLVSFSLKHSSGTFGTSGKEAGAGTGQQSQRKITSDDSPRTQAEIVPS